MQVGLHRSVFIKIVMPSTSFFSLRSLWSCRWAFLLAGVFKHCQGVFCRLHLCVYSLAIGNQPIQDSSCFLFSIVVFQTPYCMLFVVSTRWSHPFIVFLSLYMSFEGLLVFHEFCTPHFSYIFPGASIVPAWF